MLSDKGWSKLLPSTEQGPIATRIDDLEARLRRLLSRTKKELLTCVESGILEIVDDMRKSQEEFLSLLEKGKLNTTIPSIELNAELLSLRDDLGYASFLLERLGVEISPPVFAKIMSLDQHLRRLLPRVVALYRSAEDDPTPYPDLFPKSFWWRQIR